MAKDQTNKAIVDMLRKLKESDTFYTNEMHRITKSETYKRLKKDAGVTFWYGRETRKVGVRKWDQNIDIDNELTRALKARGRRQKEFKNVHVKLSIEAWCAMKRITQRTNLTNTSAIEKALKEYDAKVFRDRHKCSAQ